MSKTYDIPIVWISCKNYKVEANSLQEAIEKAKEEFLNEPDEYYIEDSFQIDGNVYDKYNK